MSTTKNKYTTIIIIACWLCVLTLCTIFAHQERSLMIFVIATFTIYTLFPFKLFSTVMFATIISIAQLVASILTLSINQNKVVVEQVNFNFFFFLFLKIIFFKKFYLKKFNLVISNNSYTYLDKFYWHIYIYNKKSPFSCCVFKCKKCAYISKRRDEAKF